MTGKDIRNHKVPAWQRGLDALAVALPVAGAARKLANAGKFVREAEELALLARLARGGCFTAGTPVQVVVRGKDGKFRVLVTPIEKVRQGNLVLARNEKTGKTQVRRVVRTTIRKVDTVLTVALEDAKTHTVAERITATREHPFYVAGKGFTPAGGLAVGNAIVTRAGPALVVQSVTWRQRAEGYTVYNFVVENDHSYFVGTTAGGAWVHNGEGVCAALESIYKRYPIGSGDCVKAANQAMAALQRSGQTGARVVRLVDRYGAPILKIADGTEVASNGFHEVVESNGRYYDALTGPNGATWEEYIKLWHPHTGPFLAPR